MEWLNYHHLLYFYVTAREGSIARASSILRLAQPTISAQLKALEDQLGAKLFARCGRGLVLTETGRTAYQYAQEIFSLGRELQDSLAGRPVSRPLRLAVGVSELVPKLLAYRILAPAQRAISELQLVCRENRTEILLQELAQSHLDLILSDAPLPPGFPVRAFNHQLGTSTLSAFAAPPLARRLRKNFPASLNKAPFLFPLAGSILRRNLDQWFNTNHLSPVIAGEFQDSALLKVFAQAGVGAFASPTALREDIQSRYQVHYLGELPDLSETYYAISLERRVKHPAVVTICATAREELFG
ncbi:MAG: transcriptional activator NhaR [Bryobacter sp.]